MKISYQPVPHGPGQHAPFSVVEATVASAHAAMRDGTLTARQLASRCLDRIAAYDQRGPALRSILQVHPQALEQADRIDAIAARHSQQPAGPLQGIPVLVKDNIECAGMATTAGAECLRGNLCANDAFVIRRLREAGAIVLAKTNLHELASGGETVSTLGGQTLNPYDLTRTPGGSSGGTAAGIAVSFGVLGLGTDGVNSIRSPASANSLVGLRPTMGLISRAGLVPCGLTQDTVGPITRTVADTALMLDVIAGHDPADPVTNEGAGHIPASYAASLDRDGLKGARIGVLRHFFGGQDVHGPVNAVMQQALAIIAAQGAELVDIDDAICPDELLASTLVHHYEMERDLDAYLSRLAAGVPVKSMKDIISAGGVHPSVEGTLASAVALSGQRGEYRARMQRQQSLRQWLRDLMARHRLDALAFPHQRRLVVPVGETQAERNGVLASATGFPAIVIPAGFSAPDRNAPQGVPVGLEFFGLPFTEPVLLRLAFSAEQALLARRAPHSTPPLE
ncbi:amidase family protein [Cupriavidus taiwanensis]|uniref:Amidase n=1 Tax=Cupriavidus taiwanensis TaxID=164546 RepID=A0A375C6E2_9BURK|nr:Amidase [Cupriavidus taiwanensis]